MKLVKITCRHAHGLLSESLDRPLSPWARFKLRTHLSICEACSRVERQFLAMRSAVRKLGQ
jgi:hypothetical protein